VATVDLINSLSFKSNISLSIFSVCFYWHDVFHPRPSILYRHLAPTFFAGIHSSHLRTVRFLLVLPLDFGPVRRNNLWWLRYLNVRFFDGFAEPDVDAIPLSTEARERALARSKGLEKFRLELRLTSTLSEQEAGLVIKHVEGQLPRLRQRNMLEVVRVE
jgi:hypothetical protein